MIAIARALQHDIGEGGGRHDSLSVGTGSGLVHGGKKRSGKVGGIHGSPAYRGPIGAIGGHNRGMLAAPRLVFVLAVGAVLALTGCQPTGPSADGLPTTGPSDGPVTSASPTSAPLPTPTPSATIGLPISIGCSTLISAQVMYDFNPNFGLLADTRPAAGSLAAEAVAADGLFCQWVNQTSGDTINVSVARLSSAGSAARQGALAGSTAVFGAPGYFAASGGSGVAQAFSGEYWIVAASPAFSEAADAQALMSAAITSLG